MISHAIANGIPVILNTNGVLVGRHAKKLVESGVTTINVSLDGAVSRNTHLYTEKASFEEVIRGVKMLRTVRDSRKARFPVIHGQFLVDGETVDEIDVLRSWGFGLGADHVKFKRRHDTMPGQVERSEWHKPEMLASIHSHVMVQPTEQLNFSARVCAHPWESVFLACTGELGICSWDPELHMNLGRMPENFDTVWNGSAVRMLRQWHSDRTDAIGEPCRRCNRLPGYLRREDASAEADRADRS